MHFFWPNLFRLSRRMSFHFPCSPVMMSHCVTLCQICSHVLFVSFSRLWCQIYSATDDGTDNASCEIKTYSGSSMSCAVAAGAAAMVRARERERERGRERKRERERAVYSLSCIAVVSMPIEPRIPTMPGRSTSGMPGRSTSGMPGRSTSGFHQPGRLRGKLSCKVDASVGLIGLFSGVAASSDSVTCTV